MISRALAIVLLLGGIARADAVSGSARPPWPEPNEIRIVGASARTLGCTPLLGLPCDGIVYPRLGTNVYDFGWLDPSGDGPLIVINVAARPEGGQIRAQSIAGAVMHWRLGRVWLQAGPGIAIARTVRLKLPAQELLSPDAELALLAGAGIALADSVTLAVDTATTVDGSPRQLVASLTVQSF
jgi:hypothetical protein